MRWAAVILVVAILLWLAAAHEFESFATECLVSYYPARELPFWCGPLALVLLLDTVLIVSIPGSIVFRWLRRGSES
jgi:hypothetical protein